MGRVEHNLVTHLQFATRHLALVVRGGTQRHIDCQELVIPQDVNHALPVHHTHGAIGYQQCIGDLVDDDVYCGGHAWFNESVCIGQLNRNAEFHHPLDDISHGCNLTDHTFILLIEDGIEAEINQLIDLDAVDIHF